MYETGRTVVTWPTCPGQVVRVGAQERDTSAVSNTTSMRIISCAAAPPRDAQAPIPNAMAANNAVWNCIDPSDVERRESRSSNCHLRRAMLARQEARDGRRQEAAEGRRHPALVLPHRRHGRRRGRG